MLSVLQVDILCVGVDERRLVLLNAFGLGVGSVGGPDLVATGKFGDRAV